MQRDPTADAQSPEGWVRQELPILDLLYKHRHLVNDSTHRWLTDVATKTWGHYKQRRLEDFQSDARIGEMFENLCRVTWRKVRPGGLRQTEVAFVAVYSTCVSKQGPQSAPRPTHAETPQAVWRPAY